MAPAAADTQATKESGGARARARARARGGGGGARGAQAQRRLRWRGRPGRGRATDWAVRRRVGPRRGAGRKAAPLIGQPDAGGGAGRKAAPLIGQPDAGGGPRRKAVPLIGPPDAGGGPRWGWRGLPGAETPAAAVALLRAVLPPCLPVSSGVAGTSLPRPGVHPPSSVRRAAGLGGKPAVPRTAFAPRRRVRDALPGLPENSYSTFQTQHKYFLKEAFSNSLPTNTFDLLGLSVLSLFHHCAYLCSATAFSTIYCDSVDTYYKDAGASRSGNV